MFRVFKFGGALLKDKAGLEKVSLLIGSYAHEPLVVVVSAIGKTTNALEKLLRFTLDKNFNEAEDIFIQIRRNHFELAEALFMDARHEVFDELNKVFIELNNELKKPFENRFFAYDQIVCFGEHLSSVIVNAFLKQNKLPCHLVDARVLLVTNDNYTSAKIDWRFTENTVNTRLKPILDNKEFVLTQGFLGADHQGHFTTLGREGSDFTAAVLANVLEADEVTIWKDVPGLMNADPKRFIETVKLENISYHEAIELAFYGASVIHPKTIQPVQQKEIPLFVRSFYDDKELPSRISSDATKDDHIHKVIIKDNQVLLSISSRDLTFIAEENLTSIFEAFAKQKIHINLMQHSAVSFSVCFNHDENKLKSLIDDLKNEFALRYNTGLELITIRYYNNGLIDQLTSGKEIFLEQKSRATVQLLVR